MAFLFLLFERLIILLFYGKMLAKQIVICKGGIYGNRTFAKLFT